MNIDSNSAVICTYGNPILRKQARKVTQFNSSLANRAKEMLRKMYIANGIGLAAPQAGELIQLIVIDLQQKDNNDPVTLDDRTVPLTLIQPLVLVNPSYTPLSDIQDAKEEGCLSLPNARGTVKRFFEISLDYQDLEEQLHTLRCNDLLARCIQHECDHLNGVLFIDHLSKAERREQQACLNDIKALGGQVDYRDNLMAPEA